MKVSKTFIVDVPCPLCNSSETAGPFECKRCGLEVCVECRELSELNVDLHRKRILCKPCVSAVEAEVALEYLAKTDEERAFERIAAEQWAHMKAFIELQIATHKHGCIVTDMCS